MTLKIGGQQNPLLQTLKKSNQALNDSIERLSTGKAINKAADDSAGLIVSDILASQARGLGQSIRNANDAMAITQVADGALSGGAEIVGRIRTLALQAAQDGQSADSRRAIQTEINSSLQALDNIAQTTSFNGQKLLDGSFTGKSFQIGGESGETVNISISGAGSQQLGDLAGINVQSQEGAEQAIAAADQALALIDGNRANLGSISNQLSSTVNNLSTTQVNVQSAQSSIADVDFAEEAMILANMKILNKAQVFAAVQTGKMNEKNMISLLQG